MEKRRIFLSSDLHLGHSNSIAYCKRPWYRPEDFITDNTDSRCVWLSNEIRMARTVEMDNCLVSKWNEVVRNEDVVYHLGDFCFPGYLGFSAFDYENRLNGTIVHIMGNHDKKSYVPGVKSAIVKMDGKSFFLIHRPPTRSRDIPDSCDIIFCGHIHDKWTHKWLDDKLLVNVGVDVRGFQPWLLGDAISHSMKIMRYFRKNQKQ